ncbi:MAG: DNA repair protein RecO [Methylobacterium sp.]|jgi:DNA repair protein RecO (recombination protein O)|nr:DNA repair protein RecO [Methylobacterium sp.]MCA3600388.1 DNA repair protein RecO [Methylobacterium sp.]MCA3605244.1 DNA repair protein RecO [Methylobacterium sp.]MCA3608284.1 DNA repair protein RecO [Methylobacterium sp.]MCA3612216.1 DNA repair protein RecO [Methylobacterium sp.]
MEWRDEGLVLATRRHGERDSILEVMTEAHGRHLGLVRGGRSSRIAPMLQPGNRVLLVWRARLEEHLGQFTAETLEARAGQVLASPLALQAVNHLGTLLRLLPEREPHPQVYAAADGLCGLLGEPFLLAETLVRFELMILRELGFGVDLSECAATGQREDLIFVSPKSGRAVSRGAGEPYAPKLLALPGFLLAGPSRPDETPAMAELLAGFRLSGFFLARHVFEPRALPPGAGRAAFLVLLEALPPNR